MRLLFIVLFNLWGGFCLAQGQGHSHHHRHKHSGDKKHQSQHQKQLILVKNGSYVQNGPYLIQDNCAAAEYNPAHTYWVDQSCFNMENAVNYPVWGTILEGMQRFACHARNSLRDENDTDFVRVFQKLFNVSAQSTHRYSRSHKYYERFNSHGRASAKTMVSEVLGGICEDWRETDNRKESHVRIYCDNGRRLHRSTSQLDPWYKDYTNGVAGVSQCPAAFGFVHTKRLTDTRYERENPDRAVITLCDSAFARDPMLDLYGTQQQHAFSWISSGIDRVTVDDFRLFVSYVLLHEWTHAVPYLTVDVMERDNRGRQMQNSAYRWANCVAKCPADSLINADNYALLGLMAWLARQDFPGAEPGGGFTLRRKDPGADEHRARRIERDAGKGNLHFYRDITIYDNPVLNTPNNNPM